MSMDYRLERNRRLDPSQSCQLPARQTGNLRTGTHMGGLCVNHMPRLPHGSFGLLRPRGVTGYGKTGATWNFRLHTRFCEKERACPQIVHRLK